MVLDVGSYPEFLPWCESAVVEERKASHVTVATVNLAARRYHASVTTRATELDDGTILLELVSGPFRKFRGVWKFEEGPSGCLVSFRARFEFKRRYLDFLVLPILEPACRAVLSCFERRARKLFVT